MYQGRFKSFPIQADEHFLTVCRYVERNAVRAGLSAKAEAWAWCSLARRECSGDADRPILSPGPVPWPSNWCAYVNRPQSEAELEALRRCVQRGQPFGSKQWSKRVAARLGLEKKRCQDPFSLDSPARPR